VADPTKDDPGVTRAAGASTIAGAGVDPTIEYCAGATIAAVDRPSALDRGPGRSRIDPKRAAGAGPGMTDELEPLLRRRLGAAALVLLTGVSMYLLRNILSPEAEPGWLWLAQGALATYLGAAVGLLWARPLSMRRLRLLELGTFGLTAAFLALAQYHTITIAAIWMPSYLPLAVKSVVAYNTLLVVTYGMFIPNSWRRAAAVTGLLTALPFAVQLALLVGRPEVRAGALAEATYTTVTDNLILTAMAIVLAVYGSHVIHTLRREAFDARQMNQYRLGRRLGAGGMGEVYLAEHRLLKRPCALKLVRPERAGDPTALERFEREVRATATLTHPNTIEIYDYGRAEDGTFYYVMQLLNGLTLHDLVARHGPLPPGRAIYLLAPACDALAEAHGLGLVHRDLKPANLFAAGLGGRHDVVKVLDFGLVAASGTDPGEGRGVAGTPLFMAPEQAAGRALDGRCDLYALGAVAYFLVAGRAPFEGRTTAQVLRALGVEDPPPLRTVAPGATAELEAVVMRCLARDPDHRFPTAQMLGDALRRCPCSADWDEGRATSWWSDHAPDAAGAPR